MNQRASNIRYYEQKHPGVVERRKERQRRAEERERRVQERAEWRKTAKERRAEQFRVAARRFRAQSPDKKREQDRAYRAANAEKVKAAQAIRRRRRWRINREAVLAENAQRKDRLQAAAHALRAKGIIPKRQWGYRIDYVAALQLVRELGLEIER